MSFHGKHKKGSSIKKKKMYASAFSNPPIFDDDDDDADFFISQPITSPYKPKASPKEKNFEKAKSKKPKDDFFQTFVPEPVVVPSSKPKKKPYQKKEAFLMDDQASFGSDSKKPFKNLSPNYKKSSGFAFAPPSSYNDPVVFKPRKHFQEFDAQQQDQEAEYDPTFRPVQSAVSPSEEGYQKPPFKKKDKKPFGSPYSPVEGSGFQPKNSGGSGFGASPYKEKKAFGFNKEKEGKRLNGPNHISIELPSSNLTDDDTKRLLEMIEKQIDQKVNDAECHQTKKLTVTLLFERNKLTGKFMNELADYLCPLNNILELMILRFHMNRIGDDGAIGLGKLLKAFTVRELHLSHNYLTIKGFQTLIEAVVSSPHYPVLFLSSGSDNTAAGLSAPPITLTSDKIGSTQWRSRPLWLRLEYNLIQPELAVEFLKSINLSNVDQLTSAFQSVSLDTASSSSSSSSSSSPSQVESSVSKKKKKKAAIAGGQQQVLYCPVNKRGVGKDCCNIHRCFSYPQTGQVILHLPYLSFQKDRINLKSATSIAQATKKTSTPVGGVGPRETLRIVMDTCSIAILAANKTSALSFQRLLDMKTSGRFEANSIEFLLIDTVFQQVDERKKRTKNPQERASFRAFIDELLQPCLEKGVIRFIHPMDLEDEVRARGALICSPDFRKPNGSFDSDGFILECCVYLSELVGPTNLMLLTDDHHFRARAINFGIAAESALHLNSSIPATLHGLPGSPSLDSFALSADLVVRSLSDTSRPLLFPKTATIPSQTSSSSSTTSLSGVVASPASASQPRSHRRTVENELQNSLQQIRLLTLVAKKYALMFDQLSTIIGDSDEIVITSIQKINSASKPIIESADASIEAIESALARSNELQRPTNPDGSASVAGFQQLVLRDQIDQLHTHLDSISFFEPIDPATFVEQGESPSEDSESQEDDEEVDEPVELEESSPEEVEGKNEDENEDEEEESTPNDDEEDEDEITEDSVFVVSSPEEPSPAVVEEKVIPKTPEVVQIAEVVEAQQVAPAPTPIVEDTDSPVEEEEFFLKDPESLPPPFEEDSEEDQDDAEEEEEAVLVVNETVTESVVPSATTPTE